MRPTAALLLSVIATSRGAPVPGAATKPLPVSKETSRAASQVAVAVGKAHLDVMRWYCQGEGAAAHATTEPCTNLERMLRIHEAKTDEARKAITADRTKRIPVDAIKAKEDSVRSRKAYEEMRAAYCAASQPSHAANCENADMALEYRAMANAELPSLKSLDKKACAHAPSTLRSS